jgi:hypothetical protein
MSIWWYPDLRSTVKSRSLGRRRSEIIQSDSYLNFVACRYWFRKRKSRMRRSLSSAFGTQTPSGLTRKGAFGTAKIVPVAVRLLTASETKLACSKAQGGNCHFKMKIILFFERDKTTSSERKYQFYNRRHCRSRCKLSKTHLIFNNGPPPYIIIQAYTKIKRLKTLQDMIVLDWSPNFSVFKVVKCLLI